MYDATVVIAEFETPGEAHVALAKLEMEGIAGVVAGDVPNAASYSMLGQMQFAAIQLSVAEADADRARDILARSEPAELEDGWEAAAESAIDGWICLNCDTEVPVDQVVCPECDSPRQDPADDEEA